MRRRGLARWHAKWWQGIEGCEGKVSRRPFRDGDFTVHIFIVRGSSLLETKVGNASCDSSCALVIKRIARYSTFNVQHSSIVTHLRNTFSVAKGTFRTAFL